MTRFDQNRWQLWHTLFDNKSTPSFRIEVHEETPVKGVKNFARAVRVSLQGEMFYGADDPPHVVFESRADFLEWLGYVAKETDIHHKITPNETTEQIRRKLIIFYINSLGAFPK